MCFAVFHFDRTPGLYFRLVPLDAALMTIWTALPLTKLTVARSLLPAAPGPFHSQTSFGQLVEPHRCRTCDCVMSSLTPAIDLPGTMSVDFGWGSFASADVGM